MVVGGEEAGRVEEREPLLKAVAKKASQSICHMKLEQLSRVTREEGWKRIDEMKLHTYHITFSTHALQKPIA